MSMVTHDRLDNLFAYQTPLVARRIRLLNLWPGSGTDQVCLFLDEVDLDHLPIPFAAVSYVWGDQRDTRVAICDGRPIKVTRSLYSALWQMRESGCTDPIWADAICINQTNPTEKTEQVRMMGDIYARARFVFIWLGEASETDWMGINLMVHICDVVDETIPPDAAPPDLSALGLTMVPSETWLAMVSVLTRPWFTRAWVVQEYVQAKAFQFRCGEFFIPPGAILGVTRRISRFRNLRMLISLATGDKLNNSLIFGPFFAFAHIEAGELTLLELFKRASGLRTTEKHDRLFALISISSDGDSNIIDYRRDFGEILRQMATQIIQRFPIESDPAPLYDYLCLIHHDNSAGGGTSWAPTFENDSNFQSLDLIFESGNQLETVPDVKFPTPKLLQLSGKIIDSIKSIIYDELSTAPVVPVDKQNMSKSAEQFKLILAFHQRVLELVNQRLRYPTDEDLDIVFWRSLIFDTEGYGKRASIEMRSHLESYHESLALSIVWIEHSAGKHSEASREEVLQEIKKWFPQLKWTPTLSSEASSTIADIWSQVRLRIRELAPTSDKISDAIVLFSWDRMFFDSDLGYVGWVPSHARVGDQICAFAGSRFPFVVRPWEDGYRLIGACYMHGIMEGEAYELRSVNGSDAVMITLV